MGYWTGGRQGLGGLLGVTCTGLRAVLGARRVQAAQQGAVRRSQDGTGREACRGASEDVGLPLSLLCFISLTPFWGFKSFD